MPQTVSIGNASFESIRRENCFLIDMDDALSSMALHELSCYYIFCKESF